MSENIGGAGASAFREFERRQAKDFAAINAEKDRVRTRFGGGKFGSLAANLTVDTGVKTSTQVWQQGAVGEAKVGSLLDGMVNPDFAVLHDRKIPRSRANIDHIVVTNSGIWVIDSKRYVGKRPERRGRTGFTVGGRKQDRLIDGVLAQTALVQAAVGDSIQVRGLLCFVDSDWPLFGGSLTIRGVRVCWPKRLRRELAPGPATITDVPGLAKFLAGEFRPA